MEAKEGPVDLDGHHSFEGLVSSLFIHGLGELPVFHARANGSYLGYMVYEKGGLQFRDKGLLSHLENQVDPPDWNKHVLGMVCFRKLLQWRSLTFHGIDYCHLATEIEPGQLETLKAAKNEYGDRLFDFIGSIYRAYQLLLAYEFLPVVLLQPIRAKNDALGLTIADLSAISLPDDIVKSVEGMIRGAVEKRLTLDINDITTQEG